ncbi:MAG: RHS domain-containing protein, partial [Deltaproteobacteria bacterium]|nr:RHS domain-containing protein [Deltaproteobacteria bacterium]
IVGIVNPSGTSIACIWDGEDNLTKYRDENGAVTTLEYAGLGEIRRRIQPDGTVVEYEYDTEEQLIGVINERKQKYTLNRNQRGYVIEEIDYWGGTRKYKYDAAQHLIEAVNPLGRVSQFTCDALGRLTAEILYDGTRESYEYNSNGNLIFHQNDAIKCKRAFDAEGHLVREEQGDDWIESSYDIRGNRISRQTSHGNKVEYAYNALNELESITINNTSAITVYNDKDGLPVKEVLGGIVERDYEYNADGLLTRQHIYTSSFELAERKYKYDPVGNLVSRTDAHKGTTYFSYDPIGRLKQCIDPKGKIEKFLHDPAGDLLQSNHQFDEGTWRRKSSYNNTDYYFDLAGNLVERRTEKGIATFEWDGNDRLGRVINERGQSVEMAYDAKGRRVAKAVDGVEVRFTWDGDQLLSDDKGHGAHREFIYYPRTFEPLAHIDSNGDIYYYQNDNVGLPHEVCSESGHVVWSATYTPLGAIAEQYEHQIDNPLRFQGQYHDEEIGLNFNRFRFYDPNVGAFVSQDPLRLVPGPNIYFYAPNHWRWSDPLGLECEITEWIDPRTGKKKQTILLEKEDDLFDVWEKETADQDYFEDIGGNYWTSADKKRRIEFSEGHEPTPRNPKGEGPHIKVMESTTKPGHKKPGWHTSKKYKVKGHESFKKDV